MINIDFLVAGCNTRCRHCYVNGAPGPMMPLADALSCIERLDTLASYLPGDTSFTLDHEPMNHPHLAQILHAASRTRHIQNYHHGMTTGIALMARKDREAVVRAYLECGYKAFGITLHGSREHHDEIVRRPGAYDIAVATAEFLKAQGAEIDVSLMFNRFFPQDADSISAVLQRLRPDFIYFAVPIITPHRNMLDFEPYRASWEDLEPLRGRLTEWRQDEEKLLPDAKQNTAAAAAQRLRQGLRLKELFAEEQDELYLSLHPDCKLYIGNSGTETQCLGDLRSMDVEAAVEVIRQQPGNRDYGAFYDVDCLPAEEDLIRALESLPPDKVYGDFASVLCRGLVELGIPTRLLF